MRILVADDTPIALEYLSEAMQMLGHEVVEATDGASALALARKECFAALLLDLRMPGMFGDRALQQLRADPHAASRTSPALAISSEMTPALAEQLQRAGFAAAFRKPVDLAVLASAMHKLLANAPHVNTPEASTPASAVFNRNALLDDAAALRVLGRKDVVDKLRSMFERELEAFESSWEPWLAQRKAGLLREALHKLSASAAICGAHALAERIAQFQHAVRNEDWCAAQYVSDALRQVLAATRSALLADQASAAAHGA